MIKFHVNHNHVGRKAVKGLCADWIGTRLAMDDGSKAPIDIMGKSLKTFFTEAIRPTYYILSMLQCLVVPYINPADQVPGIKGHILGINSSH